MTQSDINTIPKLARRAKRDGLPISEYTIRRLIKTGEIPARFIGPKAVASYSALVRYLSCADGCDNSTASVEGDSGIRRIEL